MQQLRNSNWQNIHTIIAKFSSIHDAIIV